MNAHYYHGGLLDFLVKCAVCYCKTVAAASLPFVSLPEDIFSIFLLLIEDDLQRGSTGHLIIGLVLLVFLSKALVDFTISDKARLDKNFH